MTQSNQRAFHSDNDLEVAAKSQLNRQVTIHNGTEVCLLFRQ